MPAPSMSSNLETTSAILGEYMLKGWTLTDLHCETCKATPLMREPKAAAEREAREPIQFCALCDGSPTARGLSASSAASQRTQTGQFGQQDLHGISEGRQAALSNLHHNDHFDHGAQGRTPQNAHDPDDAASSISTLLLQGYSLLGDNCSEPTCRGLPLVGYPRKKDGSRDGRKLCVGCGGRWVNEGDTRGMRLVGGGAASVASTSVQPDAKEVESPRSKKRRELYETGEKIVQSRAEAAATEKQASRGEKGKQVQRDESEDRELGLDMDVEDDHPAPPLPPKTQPQAHQPATLSAALAHTSHSLSLTLDRLASSLERHTAGPGQSDDSRYFVDVKLHTEALRDVLDVLGLVESRQR